MTELSLSAALRQDPGLIARAAALKVVLIRSDDPAPQCGVGKGAARRQQDFLAKASALAHAYHAARRRPGGLDRLRPRQCWQLRRRLYKALHAADRARRDCADVIEIVCGSCSLADYAVVETIRGLGEIDDRGARAPFAWVWVIGDAVIMLMPDREADWRARSGKSTAGPPRVKWGGDDTGNRFSRAGIKLLLARYPDALEISDPSPSQGGRPGASPRSHSGEPQP